MSQKVPPTTHVRTEATGVNGDLTATGGINNVSIGSSNERAAIFEAALKCLTPEQQEDAARIIVGLVRRGLEIENACRQLDGLIREEELRRAHRLAGGRGVIEHEP